MNIIGIIPARMASSRFPGKPLAKICGIPMIGHVYFRSRMSVLLGNLYIATCDEEIAGYGRSIGAKVIMTSDKHQGASDRAAEAMMKAEKLSGRQTDIAVMIQGDEPMLKPEMVDEAIAPMLQDKDLQIANLMAVIGTDEEWEDPNCVKVVVDKDGFAMYFSREPIPSRKKYDGKVPMFKQVALISFRRNFLMRFNELSPMPLEKVESIDMLRVLEHGYRVKMVLTDHQTYSVDTPEDLRRVEKFLSDDRD